MIAHRGASAYAPENTLAAYRLAVEQGADFVEQDLAVTRDGVLVCLHDDSLERTTNVRDVFPNRWTLDSRAYRRRWPVVEFTLDEIKALDAGSWFHARFAAERIPTWDETMAAIGAAVGLYAELKSPGLYRTRGIDQTALFVDSVRRARTGPGTATPFIIAESFDEGTVRDLAAALPDVPRTFLIDRGGGSWFVPERLAAIAGFATAIAPNKRLLDRRPERVRAAHDAGLAVVPYTFSTQARPWVRDRHRDVREEMRYYLYDLQVDALFTDNPDLFPRE
jgi:glycerophosphoryl diester phosphodiesterase